MRPVAVLALLALAVCPCAASVVNPQSPDGIAANEPGNDTWQVWLLSTAGEVWSYDANNGWEHEVYMTPPVPVADLACWWPCFCLTIDGRYFRLQDQTWLAEPPPPIFSPVPGADRSLGDMKGAYR